jgi:hypothetical protein
MGIKLGYSPKQREEHRLRVSERQKFVPKREEGNERLVKVKKTRRWHAQGGQKYKQNFVPTVSETKVLMHE